MKHDLSEMLRKFAGDGSAQALVRRTLAQNGIATDGLTDRLPGMNGLSMGMPSLPGMPVVSDDDGMARHRTDTPHGCREWLLSTPAEPASRPAIVVMLHGCTQSAGDFARGTAMNAVAGARGWHVVWPEQIANANSMRCWNWFEPGHQSAHAGEPAILAAAITEARHRIGAAKADVFIAGLSAGGAMAAVLADAQPGLMRAIGVHSGVPTGAASSVPDALSVMRKGASAPARPGRVPMVVFHGDADRTVAPMNGASLAAHIDGRTTRGSSGGRRWTLRKGAAGEFWQVEGLAHAWSGGSANGSYTDPAGPDASAEMVRFFASHQG